MSEGKTTKPMYAHYFTAADVTVDLRNPLTDKRINLDKVASIAYTHSISTIPLYLLGSSSPGFFSTGNSLVQGQLDISFTHTGYMSTAINYLLDTKTSTKKSAKNAAQMSDDELEELKAFNLAESNMLQNRSLIAVPVLLQIIITFNNTNSNMQGSLSTILLDGVKFTAQSQGVSANDDTALVDRFNFYARTIK